jgi:hypothetical protein
MSACYRSGMDNKTPHTSEVLGTEQLLALISQIHPEREVYAGKRFLKALAEKHGADACMSFVAKAVKALDEEDGLDLAFDFTPVEKRLFDRVALNVWNRRNFLQTLGWGIPGAVTAVHASLQMADQLTSSEPDPVNLHSAIHKAEHVVGKYLLPPSELMIGAALMNEAHEKYLAIKLEQVADAVSELADKHKELNSNARAR